MCKKTRLTLAMLGLAGVTFAASTGRVVVSKQGMIARRIPGTPVLSVPRTDFDDPGLVRLFSNISKYRKSPYWGWTSASVNGPHDGYGDAELWTGAPFTPTADHTVTTVKVAATWYGGINGLVLSLNNDANGVPGAAIETWQLKNLPSNLCCAIQVVTDGAGIPVIAGRQYWIVLMPDGISARSIRRTGPYSLNTARITKAAIAPSMDSRTTPGLLSHRFTGWPLPSWAVIKHLDFHFAFVI
jgi:hypothetical protein